MKFKFMSVVHLLIICVGICQRQIDVCKRKTLQAWLSFYDYFTYMNGGLQKLQLSVTYQNAHRILNTITIEQLVWVV